jgi:hypothetical protein
VLKNLNQFAVGRSLTGVGVSPKVTIPSFFNLSSLNPISVVKNKYQSFLKDSDAKVKFAIRNDPKIVVPFLDGLHCDYIVLQQLVLVKEDTNSLMFSALGFMVTETVVPTTSPFVKAMRSTRLPDVVRLYQQSYDIEIHMVPAKYWSVATTAHKVAKDLKAPDENFLDYFLKVYDSLLNVMQTQQPSK